MYHDSLETHGLALQEIHKTFLENQNDLRLFSKSLENASKRVRDVEINGYIVPGLLGDLNGSSGGSKKRKKKKKKKQQGGKDSEASKNADTIHAPKASVPISAVAEAPPEEFGDPLVAALLGMGFASDEILLAVKACGGSSRATADDLVTWILGRDTDSGAIGTSGGSFDSHSSGKESLNEVSEKTVVATKVAEENARAVQEKLQQEEAARRLAEKREEQRRRNREWNNREQARQQQAKASMGPQTVQLPPGLQIGLPSTVHADQTLQSALSTKSPLVSGLHNGLVQVGPERKAQRVSPLPPGKTTVPAQPSTLPIVASEYPTLSESTSASSKQHSRKVRSTPLATAPLMTSSNSFPALGDDDRTVSSFGSNRGLSVSSAPFLPTGIAQLAPASTAAIAPPGFMQPSPSVGQLSWKTELIERDMRVTASEFIPTRSTLGNLLSQQNVAAAPTPLPDSGALEALLESTLTDNRSSHAKDSNPFSQGFLGNAILASSARPSLGVGPGQYDQPTVATISDDAAILGVVSSLPGIPGFDEAPGVSSGGGSLGFGFDGHLQGAGTTPLLSSAFTSRPPIGDALWGVTATAYGAPPLVGLNPLNFGSTGFSQQNSTDDKDRSWAAPASGSGHGGSIW